MGCPIMDKPQNILSQDICSTLDSQVVDDLRQSLILLDQGAQLAFLNDSAIAVKRGWANQARMFINRFTNDLT